MTIYPAIAASVFPILPLFGVGGPSFTGQRASGGNSANDPVIASLSARTIYFIPAKLEDFQATFPGVQVFGTPWYGFAVAGTDIQKGDVYTDGTLAYQITGAPALEYGFVLAPARTRQVPEAIGGTNTRITTGGDRRVTTIGDIRVTV